MSSLKVCNHKHTYKVYTRWDPDLKRYVVGYACADCGATWEV